MFQKKRERGNKEHQNIICKGRILVFQEFADADCGTRSGRARHLNTIYMRSMNVSRFVALHRARKNKTKQTSDKE
jgi:hypothetical protein